MLTDFSPLHLVVLLVWIALVVAVIWSIVRVVGSTRLTTAEKVIWTIILVVFPVIGLGLWLVTAGVARARQRSQGSQEPRP